MIAEDVMPFHSAHQILDLRSRWDVCSGGEFEMPVGFHHAFVTLKCDEVIKIIRSTLFKPDRLGTGESGGRGYHQRGGERR